MSENQSLEEQIFGIIAFSGDAKSSCIESIGLAKQGEFDKALEKLEDANKSLSEAQKNHLALMQKDANGEEGVVSVLTMHAEDQMMSVEVFKVLAQEIIDLYKKLAS